MRKTGSLFGKALSPVWGKVGLALLLTSATAIAGETAMSLMTAGMPSECAEYAENVSKSEGSFKSVSPVVNGVTCYGAFQFCSAKGSTVGGTFGEYYKGAPQQFLNSPSAQVTQWIRYQKNQWGAAQRRGANAILGKEVCYNGTCAKITQSSILKACQFGCGQDGKLDNLIKSGLNCNAPGTKDGAGTSVCRYMVSGAGYDVSCITNSADGTNCFRPGKA